jgi:hypothetical protein
VAAVIRSGHEQQRAGARQVGDAGDECLLQPGGER